MKEKKTAYLLWLFLGLLGAHKFYLGKTGLGVLYMFTAGLFFIGWIIDLFTLGRQVDQYNSNPPAQQSTGRPPEKLESDSAKHVFIDYEDVKESYSSRLIEIKRVYKKGGETYIDAYCYLSDADRTFRVDRILSMREGSSKGRIIKSENMEEYLIQVYKKPSRYSSESLADEAAKD